MPAYKRANISKNFHINSERDWIPRNYWEKRVFYLQKQVRRGKNKAKSKNNKQNIERFDSECASSYRRDFRF